MLAVDERPAAPVAAQGRWRHRAAVLIPALIFAAAGWNRRWVAEDGFISLRVVRQLLAGNGPVFNAGERVEAATSPLWTFVLAAGDVVLPMRLEVVAVVLGLIGSVGGLVLATLAAQRLWGGRLPNGPMIPLGALVVAALPPYWDFATSGLETGLAFGWIGASSLVLARLGTGAPPRRAWAAAALLGLGPVVRPDLALYSGTFLVALLVLERAAGRRAQARLLGAALALPVGYELFRMGYYAGLVPNPALAKEASEARWGQGWHYLANLVGPYRLALPLACAAVAVVVLLRRHPRPVAVAALAPLAGGVLHGLYVVRVGGDFMHARLLLPSLFGALVPVMAVPATRKVLSGAAVLTVAWAVVCATTFDVPPGPGAHGITDEATFWRRTAGDRNPVAVVDYAGSQHHLDASAVRDLLISGQEGFAVRPDPNVGEYALLPWKAPAPAKVGMEEPHVGIVGVAAGTDVYVFDKLGLADALGARARLRARNRPGHEKNLDRAWIWARLVAADAPALPSSPSPEAVAAAEQALGCGDLRRVADAVRAPLTPKRFLRNMLSSFSFYKLRFDPDPVAARAELCD